MSGWGVPVAAVVVLATCLAGQTDPARDVQQLQAKDAVKAEIARRALCLLDRGSLPTDKLVALLSSASPRVRNDAVSVLMCHGVAKDELHKLLVADTDPGVKRQLLPLASDDELRRIVGSEKGSDKGPVAVGALGILQDRGALSDALLQQAIQSEDAALSETTCRILVLERSPFPLKVAEAAIDAPARQVLLELLAERPRRGAGPWVMRLLDQKKLSKQDRILAIQALPSSWLNKRLAREVVAAAGGHVPTMRFGTQIAAARFTPQLADAMVPAVVHQIQSGSRAGDVLPCLVQATVVGEQELLAQGEKLGKVAAAEVCAWLGARRARAIEERITAALAGKGKFESYLLRLAGPYLKTPEQVARVVGFLGGDDETLKVLAFDELLEAKVYHEAMLEYATEAEDRGRRAWRLLNLPRDVLPEEAFLKLLDSGEVNVLMQACQLLSTGKLSKELEKGLLMLADESPIDVVRHAAERAVVGAGSEHAGTTVWKDMVAGGRRDFLIDWLIERPRPWSRKLLVKERHALEANKQRDSTTECYYHRVLLALAGLGDGGAREALLAVAHKLEPDLLHRSRDTLLKQLTQEQVAALGKLLTDVDGRLDEEQRIELLEWVEARPDLVPGLRQLLRRLWKQDSSYEIRLGALRALLRGPGAGRIYKEITVSLARPLTEEQEEVVFEVVGSLALPLSHDAMDFLARVILLAPLADAAAEVKRSMVVGWEGTRGEYPMLRPVANLLRRDERARPRDGFRAVAESLARKLVNRRRLGMFLSLIAIRAPLFEDLGPVLARTILSAPDRSEDFVGPAHLALAAEAEQKRDYAGAARHYRLAGRYILRRQLPRFLERAFLGEADALVRYHPLADLAARPHLCDAQVLVAKRDWPAARKALARARDLALGDKETMDEVARLEQALKKQSKETPR